MTCDTARQGEAGSALSRLSLEPRKRLTRRRGCAKAASSRKKLVTKGEATGCRDDSPTGTAIVRAAVEVAPPTMSLSP